MSIGVPRNALLISLIPLHRLIPRRTMHVKIHTSNKSVITMSHAQHSIVAKCEALCMLSSSIESFFEKHHNMFDYGMRETSVS
jgi:hypothetical protein